MLVGILALQGDFFEHARTLDLINKDYRFIKTVDDLKDIDAIILPGGESTAIKIIQQNYNLFIKIKALIDEGIPTLGTCAGAILLSSNIINDTTINLNVLDITIKRNAYGRQNESFEANVSIDSLPKENYCFIRAPKIINIGENVTTIATLDKSPVGVRQKNIVAFTFHPEINASPIYLNWLTSFLDEGKNYVRSL